jgi:hypothetical protein
VDRCGLPGDFVVDQSPTKLDTGFGRGAIGFKETHDETFAENRRFGVGNAEPEL